MDESGIASDGVSSTTAGGGMQDKVEYITVLAPPVQCPINEDGTLSIGTLQSAIPSAGGLYIQDNYMRRALKADRQRDRIYAPMGGWGRCSEYYVAFYQPARHCGHCCTNQSNVYNQYAQATKSFQQSLQMVQKLMAQEESGDDQYDLPPEEVQKVLKHMNDAIPYNHYMPNGEVPVQDPTTQNKDQVIAQLQQQILQLRDDLDLKQELSTPTQLNDAVDNRISELTDELTRVCKQRDDCNWRIGELESLLNAANQARNDTQWRVGELEAELNNKKAELVQVYEEKNRLNDDNARLNDELNNCRNDARLTEQLETCQRSNDQPTDQIVAILSPEQVQSLVDCATPTGSPSADGDQPFDTELLQRKIAQVAARKAHYKNKTEDDSNRIADLEHQLNDKQNRIAELESNDGAKNEQLSTVHKERDDARWRIGELEAELGRKNDELSDAWQQKDHFAGELNRVADEKQKAEWRIGELEADINNKNEELGRVHHEKDQLSAQLQQENEAPCQQQNAQSLNAEPSTDASACKERDDKIAELEHQLTDNQNRIAELETNDGAKNEQLSAAHKERDDARWRIGELEAELSRKNDELSDAWQQKDHFAGELSRVADEKQKADGRIGELEADIINKSEELGRMHQEKDQLNAQLEQERETAGHLQNVAPLDAELQQMLSNIDVSPTGSPQPDDANIPLSSDTLRRRVNRLAEGKARYKAQVNELRQNLEDLNKQKAEMENSKNAELELIQKERNDARWRVGELEADINRQRDEKNWRIYELEAEIQRKNDELQHLKEEIENLQNQISTKDDEHIEQRVDVQQETAPSVVQQSQSQLSEAIELLSNQAQQSNSRAEQLQQEVHTLDKARNDAQWRVGELEAELGRKNDELEHVNNQRNQCEGERQSLQTQLDHLARELDAVKSQLAQTKEELIEAQQSPDNEKELLEIQDALHRPDLSPSSTPPPEGAAPFNLESLRRKVNRLAESKAKYKAQAHEHRRNEKELKKRVEELQSRMAQLENAINSASVDDQTRILVDQLEDKVRALEAEQTQLNERIKSQEEKIVQTGKERDESQWRIGELEAEIARKHNELQAAEARIRDMHGQVYEQRQKHAELERRQSGHASQDWPPDVGSKADFVNDLSVELRQALEKRCDLEKKIATLSNELSENRQKINPMQERINILERDLWLTTEYKCKLEGELNELRGVRDEVNHCKDQIGQLNHDLDNKNKHVQHLEQQLNSSNPSARSYENADHLQHQLNDANGFTGQLHERVAQLEKDLWLCAEAKSKIEWQLGESRQACAELSSVRDRIRHLEQECGNKQNHILWCEEQIRNKDAFIAQKSAALEDSFVIHKEPYVDRHKWALTMWSQLDVAHPLMRTWFELECHPRDERMVYMLGSFFNWECAVLLNKVHDGKFGVWVDLPPGRHEFRFLVDGAWRTSHIHGRCYNDFGTENNWRFV